MIRRLGTAAALPRDERWLTVRAIAAMAAARALLPLIGFRRMGWFVGVARVHARPDAGSAGRVRRAVDRAARTVPGSTCLPQALVATRLLRAAGVPGVLTIGLSRGGTGGAITAHAWARSGDLVVTGDPDLSGFSELATFFPPT